LFGTREFDPRRRAGFLSDVDYFNRELVVDDDDDGEYDDDDVDVDEEAEDDEAEYEASSDGHGQGGDNGHDNDGLAWDPETQPPDISEEEAITIAMANSELDQLSMWDGLAIQLCESSLAQERPATPPATPTRTQARVPSTAPSMAWDPWPASPQPPAPPTIWQQSQQHALPPPLPAYQLPWRMPEFIDLASDDEQ
jgi:hypothetical protein